jgi:hypothetical protein
LDCPGRTARILIAAAALAATGAAVENLPIRAARWTAPAQRIEALTMRPAECLGMPRDRQRAKAVLIGRTAFRTPLLLGGQAARAGLACESCHQSGRTNPLFLFPGLSGAPGTADVTASLMSSHRGDGIFNPKPIPDLSGPAAGLRLVPDKDPPRLRSFIHGLITEEFDGPEPPPAVLDGLVAYVRALSPAACGRTAQVRVTLRDRFDDLASALRAAAAALADKDAATARLMLAGARAQLGLIDERFRRPSLEPLHARLLAQDQEIASLQAALAAPGGDARLAALQVDLNRLEKDLRRAEALSYFNSANLSEALK